MGIGLLLQYLVIAMAVLISAGYVVQRQWPTAVRKLRVACAIPLMRDGRPAWMRRAGRWLAPRALSGADACGTGCNGCGPTPPGR